VGDWLALRPLIKQLKGKSVWLRNAPMFKPGHFTGNLGELFVGILVDLPDRIRLIKDELRIGSMLMNAEMLAGRRSVTVDREFLPISNQND
jgi:hypothetical protein